MFLRLVFIHGNESLKYSCKVSTDPYIWHSCLCILFTFLFFLPALFHILLTSRLEFAVGPPTYECVQEPLDVFNSPCLGEEAGCHRLLAGICGILGEEFWHSVSNIMLLLFIKVNVFRIIWDFAV